MLEKLKKQVCAANLALVSEGLVIETWGNASAVDRAKGLVVIKPSGVDYRKMKASDMVVVSLETGARVEGNLSPSSDTPTHLALYRAFDGVGGIVHTHSLHATAWAQSCRPLPALGTTHADYFHGPIPCTCQMAVRDIATDYEANTGKVMVQALAGRDPLSCPAVLVASHGPFTWGRNVEEAVHHAVILEHLARLAAETLRIAPSLNAMQPELMEKHFSRKHGPGAYYGQATGKNSAQGRPK